MKNKTFKVGFVYEGKGELLIEAASEKRAREIFLLGEWEVNEVNDDSSGYSIEYVDEIKN